MKKPEISLTKADFKTMAAMHNRTIKQTANIVNDYSVGVLNSIFSVVSILVPHVKLDKDNELLETDDKMGQLPLLTEEELCSLKDFLKHWKDYRQQEKGNDNA